MAPEGGARNMLVELTSHACETRKDGVPAIASNS
jgi:hypothetical protein